MKKIREKSFTLDTPVTDTPSVAKEYAPSLRIMNDQEREVWFNVVRQCLNTMNSNEAIGIANAIIRMSRFPV